MENLSIIAAIGANYELGEGNKLIWHLPGDLHFFKEMTMGKTMVMGSNTFYSLPRMLPGRKHIVLTSKTIDIPDVITIHSKEELLEYLKELKQEIMIIGGSSIYRQFIEYADKMYLTHIDATRKTADAYFPRFNIDEWNSQVLKTGNDNGISYKHVLYRRKNNN